MGRNVGVRRIGILLAWIVAAVILCSPAQAAGNRLVTQVDRPVEINGELYPAGELSIREVDALSPTETLNEVCAAGECLGLLRAQSEPGGTPSSGDAVVFEPDERGHLVLVGFSYRGQSAREFACPRTASGAARTESGPPVAPGAAPSQVAVK